MIRYLLAGILLLLATPAFSQSAPVVFSTPAPTPFIFLHVAPQSLIGNATTVGGPPANIDITALPSKSAPVPNDVVLLQDSQAGNAFKRTTVGAIGNVGSVASIMGNVGAFTLDETCLTISGTEIKLVVPLPTACGGVGAGVWTPWTPSVTPSSGAFLDVSTSGAYYSVGKYTSYTFTITILSVGSASGAMSVPLPVGSPKRPSMGVCGETANTGTIGVARNAGTGNLLIVRYDAGSLIATNNVVTCTGIYEQS